MGLGNEIQIWLTSSLLALGLVVFLVGLWILIFPASFLKAGRLLGTWVNTDSYFDAIDKPRYQEGLIYRHHRVAGGLIVVGAIYTLIMLMVRVEIRVLTESLPKVINLFWSEWFYGALYSLLVGANAVAVVIGIVVFIRPSMLKRTEKILNMWISPDFGLKKLDEPHEISVDIFPGGKPRLFGLAVVLGGLYIMLSMGLLLQ